MAKLLIAVGGTGQHVALAVARMTFIGALPPIELAVIDADNDGELSRLLKTFNETVVLERTTHPLLNGERIDPPFKDVHGDPQFQDLFLSSSPSDVEREVFEVCVDASSAGLSVKKGMFGRPAVGASIFAENQDTMLQDVFRRAGQASTIFVSGSMVGGTGAGIIHQLVAALPKTGKELYGLIFLQWFRIPAAGTEQPVDDTTQERNMRFGLDYFFRETRKALADTLLIGQPLQHGPAVEATAKEIKHYLHLIAAYGILHLPQYSEKQRAPGSVTEAAFDEANPESMYEEDWGGQKLKWYVNRANFVKEVLDYASDKKFQAEVLNVVSPGLLGRIAKGDPANIGKGLAEAIQRHPSNQRKTIVEVMMQTWALLSKQYKFSLDWLDDVIGPLPEQSRDSRYKGVRDQNVVQIVTEIKAVWGVALPEPETLPEPQDLAHQFHDLLVQSYLKEK
jgi:hypothetical protein